jgi:hypothetical protein
MGSSLQEQLLKAGLVSEQKVRQARTDKRKQGRQPGGRTADPGQVAAQKARDEKAERDRDLNRKREEAARRKAVTAEVVEIIRSHRVPRDTGDTAYHFVDGKMVRRIYVTAEQQRQLVAGQLVVARLGQRYELIPPEAAEKIRARNEGFLVPPSPPSASEAEDEAYAQYRVPDDLMW